jgi:hypothetical protein
MKSNQLLNSFINKSDRMVFKWIDYFEVYEKAFSAYKNKPITFLEIGIQNGGSLQMWRKFFGPEAKIIGIDIDPKCKALEAEGFEIWIGNQADPNFWTEIKNKNPSIDLVLDDGGHTMEQQIVTFQSLFPILAEGGTYACEDTHTSYFPSHGGGLKRSGTFHEYIKMMIDEMHAWYYAPLSAVTSSYLANNLYSISVYDSIIVMEKRRKNAPIALARGFEGDVRNPASMTYIELRHAFGVPD